MKCTIYIYVITFIAGLLFSNLTIAQTTSIPDTLFEQALIDLGLDTGTIDGVVLTANIDTVTYLDISYQNISNLTGIEDFTALTKLWCDYNPLFNLDVSQNTALITLWCANDSLISLDVTQNTALTDLQCSWNQLTNIDVTQNISLMELWCDNNQLTSLDVTQNTALTDLYCRANQITSLNVSQNTALVYFDCNLNQITSLDLTQNPVLTTFSCYNNSNQLNCLNVKNGNNINITYFNSKSNPNLTCIEVDDVAWSTANWIDIDPATSFSTSCGNPCSSGVDENNFANISLYPNPTTGNIIIDLGQIKTRLQATLRNNLGQIILTTVIDESTDYININP